MLLGLLLYGYATGVFSSRKIERATYEAFLQAHRQETQIDEWVQVGAQERLPVRLIAVKSSVEQAKKKREWGRSTHSMPRRHKGAQRCGPRRGKQPPACKKKGISKQKTKRSSAIKLRLADWTILLTNVQGSRLSVDEVLVLMRIRWQEELLWKLWKQYGKIDTWRSEKPVRIETEIYAKLIGVLIEHWMDVLGCWQDPRRSLRKAQQMSQWAASALSFARIAGAMNKGCRIDSRRTKPNTYQLVASPQLIRAP